MSSIYNPLKLPEYRKLFKEKKILIVGAGAVGSALMEYLAKMGVSADALDFDHYTLENAAKGSCLIRTPEDAGRNKAECASARIQPLLDEGCTSNGVDADLCLLGPEAFADYDFVIAAVDNYDAKVLLNELVRQLDDSRRPILLMDGTKDETAQSVICDGKEFCLRCLIDEAWMKDSEIRTSCGGPQIRSFDGIPEIVRTSNLASSMAAHLSAEQIRAYVTGAKNVVNRRITYTAYPYFETSITRPMRKRGCPGCSIKAPDNLRRLHGSVMENTLEDAFTMIATVLETDDFEILVHQLHYHKVTHADFIITDICRCCGKEIRVMKHSGCTFPEDLRCKDCRDAGRHSVNTENPASATCVKMFTPGSTTEAIRKMRLYDLGYPLGAHIHVIQRNGALDFLDKDKIVLTAFAFDQDSRLMHSIHRLC